MTRKNSTRGFTLLEVLIAILILGIIATGAIPLLSDYTEQARDARMAANVQALDRAVQRYELDHQAPWGFVYEPLSEDGYIPYNWEGGLGFVEQLEKPTDTYGNVMGDPGSSVTGPCVHGPYVSDAFAPAALLLGVTNDDLSAIGEGDIVVIGVAKKLGCGNIDPEKGFPVLGGVGASGGFEFRKLRKADKDKRKKDWNRAIAIDHPLIFEHVAKLDNEEARKRRRAARDGARREAGIGAIELLSKPRLTIGDEAGLRDRVRIVTQQLGGAEDRTERAEILRLLGEILAAPGNEKLFLPTIPDEIKKFPNANKLMDEVLAHISRAVVVGGPRGRPRETAVVTALIRVFQGEPQEQAFREGIAMAPPGESDVDIQRRAELIGGLLPRTHPVVDDHARQGMDYFVEGVVAEFLPAGARGPDADVLLEVKERVLAGAIVKNLREAIGEAVKKSDVNEARALLEAHRKQLPDSTRIAAIFGVFERKSLDDWPRTFEPYEPELIQAQHEKIRDDFEYQMTQAARNTRNDAQRKAALQGLLGFGARPHVGTLIACEARPKVHMGVIAGAPKRLIECTPDTVIRKISVETAGAARAVRQLQHQQPASH